MQSYRKILVPVDGSPLSDLSFGKALSLAELIDGEVTVIHVIEPVALNYTGFEETDISASLGMVESESVKSVRKMLDNYMIYGKDSDVPIKTRIMHGSVASEIVDLSSNFDLIIMGTQGRNMLSSLFLGSVAEKVARHACCPVMLVREFKKDCHKRLREN
ncbi:MAG: universal stress protein [Thermoplasmatota archaeon]